MRLALAVTMLLALSSVPVNTSATTNSSKGTRASGHIHVTRYVTGHPSHHLRE
jgi:hypothetical protein